MPTGKPSTKILTKSCHISPNVKKSYSQNDINIIEAATVSNGGPFRLLFLKGNTRPIFRTQSNIYNGVPSEYWFEIVYWKLKVTKRVNKVHKSVCSLFYVFIKQVGCKKRCINFITHSILTFFADSL